jgi:hypothetical protein
MIVSAVRIGPATVLATGRGRTCRCDLRFRTTDSGATWTEVAATAAVTRGGLSAMPCSSQAAADFCGGFLDASGRSPAADRELFLTLEGGRYLIFGSSGVFCSTDGGRSWGRRCP